MAYRIDLFDYNVDGEDYYIGYGNLSQRDIKWQIDIANGEDLEVHISSTGGSLFDAIAIYDLLKRYKGKVTTYIDSIAASAASIIAMAGQQVVMSKYALLMIHKPAGAVNGTADDLATTIEVLNQCQERLVAIYMDKTGLDEETINSLVNAETWLSADQAKELGFIDLIEDYQPQITNFEKIKVYAKAAPQVCQRIFNKIQIQKPNTQEMNTTDKELIEKTTSVLDKIMNFFKATFVKTVTNKGTITSFTPLAVGVKVTNDAGEDCQDGDYEFENKDGKKVTAKVKAGAIENMADGEEKEADETDEDVQNRMAVTNLGIKITNKADYKNVAPVVLNLTSQLNTSNALIVDLTNQLKISNAAVSRDEETIRTSIKSEYVITGSQRSNTTGVKDADHNPFAPTGGVALKAMNRALHGSAGIVTKDVEAAK